MITIAVTGSIASGKSFFTKCMGRMRGVRTFSSDKMVHHLYEGVDHLGKGLKEAIFKKFPEVKLPNNQIDRLKLGQIVFTNFHHKEWLEDQVHPRLRALRQDIIKKCITNKVKIVVFEVPLLFENYLESDFDYSINLFCSPLVQYSRAMKRRGMNDEKFYNILSSQMDFRSKIRLADYSINSGLGKAHTVREAKAIYNFLLS